MVTRASCDTGKAGAALDVLGASLLPTIVTGGNSEGGGGGEVPSPKRLARLDRCTDMDCCSRRRIG